LVSTRTLSNDLNRWWQMTVLHKEDPYLKVGSVNDRSKAADSEFVWALKDIDFKVEQGDVVGIIGKNGAGKSTLLKILSRVTGPTTGSVRARGKIGSLLEVGTGFHPEMTGRENIYMNGAILGMTRQEISRKLDEIVDFSGCERYIDTPVKRYSSGMTVRLGFAVAAFLDPEILVVDEVLAVGDAEFQKKAIGKMQDVSRGEGRTVLFVSHNMASVRQLCNLGILLCNGTVDDIGQTEMIINKYLGVDKIVDYNIPLSKRKDRVGNGRVKLNEIRLFNRDGSCVTDVFVGDYLRMEFHLDVQDNVDLSSIIVGIKLMDNFNNPCVLWASDEMTHDFSTIKNGVFSLEVPEFNVRPNCYNLYFQLSMGSTSPNDFCDVIYNATRINVISNSFFDRSILLKEGRDYSPLIKGRFV